jgi:predicted nucleotidyltransferase
VAHATRTPPARPTPDDPLLKEIVRRLVKTFAPERIYLFGSTARGDAGPDSDYDLLVVVPDETPRERRRVRRGYEALAGLARSGDILVWPKQAFDARLHLRASLPSTVVREGMLLYAG